MSSETIFLRPHHGMCMAYFVGHGYSDGFTAHMGALIERLTPETMVMLTVGTDAVCAACPNNNEGVCEQAELVAGYDEKVLALCELRNGQTLPFGHFTSLVQSRIIDTGLRKSICGGCQWNAICESQRSRWE